MLKCPIKNSLSEQADSQRKCKQKKHNHVNQ